MNTLAVYSLLTPVIMLAIGAAVAYLNSHPSVVRDFLRMLHTGD